MVNAPPAAGSKGYGLNILLAATQDVLGFNSLRVARAFVLMSVQAKSDGNFSLIFGNQFEDFCSGYVRSSLICGNAALPHFFVQPLLFKAGDSIVVKTRNDTASSNAISLLFQGKHL